MTNEKETMSTSNYPHVMIDLETLDVKPGAVVLSIGLVEFAAAKDGVPQLGTHYYDVLSAVEQFQRQLTSSADTIDWWEKQSPEARTVLQQSYKSLASVRTQLDAVNLMMAPRTNGTKPTLWGNGSDFDNTILAELYRRFNVKPAWSYSRHRCHRTLMALCGYAGLNDYVVIPRLGQHHNALDDAVHQAKMASRALELFNARGMKPSDGRLQNSEDA